MRRPHHPKIEELWASDSSLSALLGLLMVLIFFIHPMIALGYDLAPIASLTFTLVLLSGVMAVPKRRSGRIALGALSLLAVTVHLTRYMEVGPGWESADAVATFIACGLLAAVVFVQVFRPGPITFHRIQGALAGYLLIAIMFASAYAWIDLHNLGAFTGDAALNRDQRASRLAYFSLVTLTTVGYGDMTPVHQAARSLAMLEALTGQLYPAILIARLVTLHTQHHENG